MRKGQRLAPSFRFTVSLNSVETKLKWGDVIRDYADTFSVDLQRRIIYLSVLEDRERFVSRLLMNLMQAHPGDNEATNFQLVHTDIETNCRMVFEGVWMNSHLLEGYGYDQGQNVTHRVELGFRSAEIEPQDPPVH